MWSVKTGGTLVRFAWGRSAAPGATPVTCPASLGHISHQMSLHWLGEILKETGHLAWRGAQPALVHRQGSLTSGSTLNVPTDREDGCLPAVPQHFVQNARSADRSGCLRWRRDQYQWVVHWWHLGLESSLVSFSSDFDVTLTFQTEFSDQWPDLCLGSWGVYFLSLVSFCSISELCLGGFVGMKLLY